MRRVLAWAAGLGLLGAALLVAAPAGGQTAITLSVIQTFLVNGVSQERTVTSTGEDDSQFIASLRASVPSNVSANVTVSVTVGASGSTATQGTSCTLSGFVLIDNCGGDYGVSTPGTDGGINDNTFSMIIDANTKSKDATIWIKTTPDKVTENNEIIRISGTTTTSGYTVSSVDLTINDADRTIRLTGPRLSGTEGAGGGFSGHNIVKADLGSGNSRDSFVASTSSTYSSDMRLRILAGNGTVGSSEFQYTPNNNRYARFVKLDAGSVSSNNQVNSQGTGGYPSGQIAFYFVRHALDTIAEGDETIELYFANLPAGFTALPHEYILHDDGDDDISLSVDTSSEDGDQSSLAEGGDGSGVTVSAAFPAATTGSTIGSATVVTLSAAGAASPGAGRAGTADLSYAPSSPNTITFPARSLTPSGTATLAGLTITDDSVVEGPETFTVGGSSALGAAGGAAVTIVDDDADVSLSVSPAVVEEGSPVDVTVTAKFAGTSSVLTSPTEVTVTLAGATMGGASANDFSVSGSGVSNNEFTVSIPARDTEGSAMVRVTAAADSAAEGAELVAVSGSASVGGEEVDVTEAELTLTEPIVTLSLHEADGGEAALAGVVEGAGERVVRVRAGVNQAVASDTTVAVAVGAAGGTARPCTGSGQTRVCPDFTPGADTLSITIPAGQRWGAADVTIAPVVDTIAEGRETIRFSGSAMGYVVTGADLGITETIEVTLSSSSVGEGAEHAGAVTATAAFLGATSSTVTEAVDVTLSFAAGAGAEAADFTAPGTAVTLTIPANMTSVSGSGLSGLLITGDTFAEGAEVIDVGGAAVGFAVTGTSLTITDDDLGVTLQADTDVSTLAVFEKTLAEGSAPSVRVRASLGSGVTNETGEGLAVSVRVGEESPISAAGGGVDFTAPSSPVTVTIPAGQTQSGWATLTGLRVTDDSAAEGAETFRVAGTVTIPGGTVAPDTLTIGASDDELEVAVSPGTVIEQAAAHTITVTAGFRGATSSELTAATSVTVAVASGDTNGASLDSSCPPTNDACVSASSFTVSIPRGQTSGSGTFDVTARNDNTVEAGGETLKVTGTAGSQSDSATLRIVDSGITLTFQNAADSSALTSLAEGSAATTVQVQVTMPASAASRRVVGLNIAPGPGTEEDTDGSFTMLEDFRVSGINNPTDTPVGHDLGVEVPANTTMGTANFTITVHDDDIVDGDKTIRITGSDVGSVPVVGSSLTITDNDTAPTNIDLQVSFEDANGNPVDAVREDGGTTRVRVRASYQGATVLTEPTTVALTVGTSGEATSGTDYQAVTGATVTISALESSGEDTFELVIGNAEDDADAEGPEMVTIAGSVTGFTVDPTSLMIVDDDYPVTLELLDSSNDPLTRVGEGDASQTVTVRASYPGSSTRTEARTIRVSAGGEASSVSAADYQATAADPFEITIPGGDNSATGTFTLAVRDDNVDEEDEILQVAGDLDGFAVIPADLTITDNDGPPTGIMLSVNPRSVPENRGTSRLAVTVTAALVGSRRTEPTPVRVNVGGSGSTASSGSDYQNLSPRSFTVTIPAEQPFATGTFRVVILSDSRSEQTERIAVTGTAAALDNASHTTHLQITNVESADPGGNGGGGGGGGGAPPPSGGGGGGGGGGGAPPPAGPPPGPATPPPPPAPVCQGRFCDEDGSVHQANIEQIAAWEITLGCDADDATKFCPSAQITRRQMAAFLHRAVNRLGTIPDPAGVEISDVPADAWYRTFAEWVVSTGAFAAPDGIFNPGGVVTRADMAVMMIASFPDINAVDEPEGLFNDVTDADPEVVRAVEGMYHTGVTRGCSTTPLNYCPDQPVTRAQMASFFVRAVNYTPPAAGE